MKLILVFILILFSNLSNAKSFHCNFEEVYQDGTLQFGQVLFHEGLLRYQYNDKQLFTIIFNKDYYAIRNNKPEIVNKLEKNNLLNELTNVLTNYPNIKKNYKTNDMQISIESSYNSNFLKRISIMSPDTNLSIYLINCDNKKLSKKYFQPFSIVDISF